jgi:hypothetical protein
MRKILFGCVIENNYSLFSKTLRLLQSIRWFGGALANADIMVCVVDEIDSYFKQAFEALRAIVFVVPRFDPKNPLASKLEFLLQPQLLGYETVILLDCSTILVQDPTRFLLQSTLQARITDVPVISNEVLERVCKYFGLTVPKRKYHTTFDKVPTIWFCNTEVIVFPVALISKLVRAWCEYELNFSANPDLLGPFQLYREQVAFSLAFIKHPIPFSELPVKMNFPLHITSTEPPADMFESDPVILHYDDR